jgi:hypothetical protein
MIRIPQKKSFSFAVILICAVLLTVFYGIPLSDKMDALLKTVDPIFDSSTPIVNLRSGELDFDGTIPHRINLENGIQILFEYEADSTLLDSLPNYSTLLTTEAIYYKNKEKIKQISVQNIETEKDRIEINPVKVGLFLTKFSTILTLISGFIIFITFIVSLYIIVLVATGVSIMVDAFSDGPYSFSILFKSASVFMLLIVLAWMLLGFSTLGQLKYMLIFYVSVFIILVYMTIRLARRA